MKTLAAFLLAFVFVIGAAAQDEQLSKKELRKLQKEQRKAEQAALEEQAAMMTKGMVTGQRFVLEAEFLSNREGSRVPVQSIINFVMVDSLTGTLQLGSAMEVGYNG